MALRNEQPVNDGRIDDVQQEPEELTIDLQELLYRLLENAKYVVAAALAGALLAAIITIFFIAPKYVATAKLYVLSSKDSAINLSDLQLGNYLAKDYKEVFANRHVHQRVMENLNLNYSYEQLNQMVQTSNPSDTRILYISVTSTSATEAQIMANEYARVAREFIAATMDTSQPNVFEEAWLPKAPSSPRKMRNIALGFFVGLFAACGVIFVLYIQDDKIRRAEDIQKYVDLPTLGLMPVQSAAPVRKAAGVRPKKRI